MTTSAIIRPHVGKWIAVVVRNQGRETACGHRHRSALTAMKCVFWYRDRK
jgi:hypothetical protein